MVIKVGCYSEHRECLDRECYGPMDLHVFRNNIPCYSSFDETGEHRIDYKIASSGIAVLLNATLKM